MRARPTVLPQHAARGRRTSHPSSWSRTATTAIAASTTTAAASGNDSTTANDHARVILSIGGSAGSGVTMKDMSQVVDSLDAAREAVARFAWREAYEAYSSVDRKDLTPEDFESFGDAAWWSGKLDDAIKQRERSYAGFSAAGDKSSAARLALALAWDHEGRAAYAVSQGWFANRAATPRRPARVGRAREDCCSRLR